MNSATPDHALKHKQLFLNDPSDVEEKLDLVEYWRSVSKRKKEILGLGIVFALLAAAVVFAMTPIYRSTATLLVESNKNKVVSIEDVYSGASQNREFFQTQVEILKSREVAIKSIIRLKLWEQAEFDPRKASAPWYATILKSVGMGDDVKDEWTEERLANGVFKKFESRLTVEPVRLSQLIRVSFDAADKDLAAKVANGVATEYIENDLDTRYQMTRSASNWLQERLGSLREKLNASEQQLQTYRDSKGIVDVKNSAQSGAGKQLDDVSQKLVEAKVRRAEAENAYNQIRSAAKGADLTSVPAIVRNPVVGEALKQKSEAERKVAELGQRYGTEHPKYVQAEGELRSAKENVKRQVDTVAASLVREYEAALATERAMSGILGQSRGAIQDMNRKEFQLTVLEREVDSNKQIYEMFMKRAKETNVSGDLQSPVARIVDPAVTSGSPAKPAKLQIIAIALVIGLFAGVIISLFLDRLDNTLKTTEDVETKLKQPLLTSLPLLEGSETDRADVARLFLDKPQSLYAESIRTARTGVLLSAIDLPNRILLVTSSLPGEGKSTFSINLALAHAHTKKTLLIDADMRRPSISKSMGMEAGSKGLSNLVSGTADFKECLHRFADTNLSVLPSGNIPPNPLELLLSDRFKTTLDKLATVFDIIIIDSPPVELVSDSLVIASHATGVIYVVKAEDTPYQLARKGLMRIKRAEGNILGVVLNRLDFVKAERYYGEYSGYGKYGYSKYGYKAKGANPYQSTYGSENHEEAKT